MAYRVRAAVTALCVAVASGGSAQADQHRGRPLVTAASPRAMRDGISGNSVARAGAHGLVGGPAAARPAAISSTNPKQHH